MQEENFRKTILGYNKEDVTSYIESLMSDNRRIVKIKEDSIQNLQKKASELELKVNRLQDLEKQFFGIQEKLQYAARDLEERDTKIELLSQKVHELEEKLSQSEENSKLDHSIEEEDNEKNFRINELESQLRAYHENMKSLMEKESIMEHEKARIGNAILRAQEKACDMDREFNMQYDIESEKLQTYKKGIDSLRKKAVEVLQLLEDDLTLISDNGSSLETLKSETDPISSAQNNHSTEASRIQLIKTV